MVLKSNGLLLVMVACLLALPAVAGDDEEARKLGVTPPAEWAFPPAQPLQVWSVRGLWYDQYGLDRALARVGGCVERSSWVQGNWIRWYSPDSYDELMRYHLAIIANTNGHAFANGRNPAPARTRLKDYAANGGAVLFLGGFFAFGREYHGTALEEMAPVTFAAHRDLERHPAGVPLAAGPDAPAGFAKLNWAAAPRVYWTHAVTLKPGAKVLLTAGGKPLLVAWPYGNGRVAVFAGTVMGDPPAGHQPFWQWDGWPAVMADTIRWLTTNPARPGNAGRADYAKTLNAALAKAGGKAEAERAVMTAFLRQCADPAAARAVTDALASLFWDITLDEADAYYAAVLPYARGGFGGIADALLASGHTHKTMLGLRLLGCENSPGTRERLLDALKRGDVDVEEMGDDLDPGRAGEDAGYRAYAYRLAALEGLGNLGDPAALPAIRAVVKQYEGKRPRREEFPKDVTREHELYQAALQAALRCGDAAAAGPLVDLLMQNRYTLVNMMFAAFSDVKGPAGEAQRARAQRAYARLQARQQLACGRLAPLPASVLSALAARLAAEDDPWVAPIAFAAFGKGFGAGPPADALAILTRATVPAVADLAGGR